MSPKTYPKMKETGSHFPIPDGNELKRKPHIVRISNT